MTQPSLEQIQFRLQYWSSKAEEYVAQSKRNNGTLKQQQWWELEYFRTPYLTAASDGFLRQRFIDHFHNCARLTKEGRISIVPLDTHDGSLIMPLISHLNLEISARGGIRGEWLEQANVEIDKYFENRPTRGEQLLKGMPENISGVVVKFAEKKQYMQDLMEKGALRLTPAGHYDKPGLRKAMRDRETEREFHFPVYKDLVKGRKAVDFNGISIPIKDGFATIVKECPDYLLWSACEDIDRRVPTDFASTAALIIKEPKEFHYRVRKAVAKKWPQTPTWFGRVDYYDPCAGTHRTRRPETIKYFSYLYQRETRLCVFPKSEQMPIEPVDLCIGPIDDISELISI